MTPKPNPFAARAARRNLAGSAAGTLPGQQGSTLPEVPSTFSNGVSTQPEVSFAQGRAEKMMLLSDLPDPVETPEATGDLSQEEEEILALCMRGVKQFENAWWVMGKAMANINARRLYRKTHATFEDFARDVFDKSRPLAYEEMTSYAIGELMSARADRAFEDNSNKVSARADITIGKKAAGALNPVTKDYGPEVAVAVHETITDATGKSVPVKVLKGVITQLPRKKEQELTQEELTTLARELATKQEQLTRDADSNGKQTENRQPEPSAALTGLRSAVAQMQAAHRALAPAKVKQALQDAPDEAARLLTEAKQYADKVKNRADAGQP
ncbi:hypothetical protein [Streptomyces chrestomyceticus]|uniref:hypothetical protein n=1 Tax=Streptomyces chrestomyceticus TaxID=68185 RepID=UPI0033D8B78F